MKMTHIKSNLWKIYTYKFLSEFYLIVPILIPYYESNNLNSLQIFTIQASYALSLLIFEIPSGYLADVIGRKKTLIIGSVAFPIGLGIYALTGTFYSFILAEFVLAIANSMRSGCDSAIIYDSLIQMNQESEYKKFEGKAFFFTRIGTSTSSILGGLLALSTLRLPFLVNIVTGSLMIPVALMLIEPARDKLKPENPFKDIFRICRFSFSHPKLRLYILYAALLMSTGVSGVWAYFLYYESLGISIGYFGILFAIFQLSSAMGASKAHAIEKRWGQKRSLFILLLISPLFILLGIIKSVILIPLIFLIAFLWGYSFPLLMDSMNHLIESDIRATVLSIANMSVGLSFAILGPVFGKTVDLFSLSFAFVSLGIYFLVYAALVLTFLFRRSSPANVNSTKP